MGDDAVYLSPEKHEELKEEFARRQKVTRKEIAERISSAKELGDLSENFEYHQAKEEQRENEERIFRLDDMLRKVSIIEVKKGGTTIGIGTKFTVEINGEERHYDIVGSNEAEPGIGKISNESPIGQLFLGRAAGETIELDTAAGTMVYQIKSID